MACLRSLAESEGLEVLAISFWRGPGGFCWETKLCPPGAAFAPSGCGRRRLFESLRTFDARVVAASGWLDLPLLYWLAQWRRERGGTVGMWDTPLTGKAKQAVKAALGGGVLRAAFSAVWVAGPAAGELARSAGFVPSKVWEGLLCADDELFGSGTGERLARFAGARTWPRRFVFVGRLAPEKNLKGLLEAYGMYRVAVPDPWSLEVVGDGPCRRILADRPGVEATGWMEPGEIASRMASAGALVLPSLWEHWGIVVHEACLSGLPILLSTKVGAASRFFREGVNGMSFDPTQPSTLANAMTWISRHPAPWQAGMASFGLGTGWTRQMWTRRFLEIAGGIDGPREGSPAGGSRHVRLRAG
jgi:glycosyltransferase involved in cell wall biosynthesis